MENDLRANHGGPINLRISTAAGGAPAQGTFTTIGTVANSRGAGAQPQTFTVPANTPGGKAVLRARAPSEGPSHSCACAQRRDAAGEAPSAQH